MQKRKMFDGFVNLLKSFGGSNDTRTQTGYSHTARISQKYTVLDDLYATSWLAAKVVDIPVDDALREGRTFLDIDEKKKEELEDFYIQVDKKINLALKYARIFGGSALIIVSKDDSIGTAKPKMIEGDLVNIAVVDASQLIPQQLERNPLSPNYLKPTSYTVTSSTQTIDASRVLYVDGVTTTNRERETNNGFGSSIYERINKNIEDATQTNVALRNLVEQSNLDIVKMEGLNDAVASNAEAEVQERIQVLSKMKSMLNTIAIDKNDDYINIAKNFANLDTVQMNMFMLVSAAADIPFTRFMGKSADGQNATGKGDLINYYDSVKAEIQIDKLQEIYSFLDPIINLHLFGVEEPFKYEFNPLFQMTEDELATINQTKANTHAIYLDRGVVTDAVVLVEVQKDGLYSDYDPDKQTEFKV